MTYEDISQVISDEGLTALNLYILDDVALSVAWEISGVEAELSWFDDMYDGEDYDVIYDWIGSEGYYERFNQVKSQALTTLLTVRKTK